MSPRRVERPEGLSYQADFISTEEDEALLAFVRGLDFREVTMRGYPAKRRTVQFGVRYELDRRHVEPTQPIPHEILPLRDRCAAAAGVSPELFVELLATRYPAGAGIGWHRYAPQFGSVVAGISLATACTMKFRKRSETPGRGTTSCSSRARSTSSPAPHGGSGSTGSRRRPMSGIR